jgi:hypothetical protein
MKSRQEKWLEKGYTKEQIENHLTFERHKSKLARERRKENNKKNLEQINDIKADLLGITFDYSYKKIRVTKISPSIDGKGFWFKYTTEFKDGSKGEFRQFSFFDDYSCLSFMKDMGL